MTADAVSDFGLRIKPRATHGAFSVYFPFHDAMIAFCYDSSYSLGIFKCYF